MPISVSDPSRLLGSEIKRVVDRSPMLKKQVARNLGVSPALLSNWFAGRAVPSGEHIETIASLFVELGEHDTDHLRDLWQRSRRVTDITPTINSASERTALVEFLGLDADDLGVTLVYPQFTLNAGHLVPHGGAELHPDLTKFPSSLCGDRLERFGSAVSSHDLDAMSTLADLFADHDISSRLATDVRATRDGGQRPMVAIGLQSNAVTTFYLRSGLNGSAGSAPLFRADSVDQQRVTLPNGFVAENEPPIWRGLIARVTPRPRERPEVKWVFCSGLSGLGTAIAANYLSTYWQELQRDTGRSDFVAIVAGHELTPASATLEELYVP